MPDIIFTTAAAARIKEILIAEGDPTLMLRVYVKGGGCSGFQYGFSLDHEIQEDDFQFETDGIKLLIDPMSMQYLQGSTIDFTETLEASQFSIKNPNSTGSCGCGSSFSA